MDASKVTRFEVIDHRVCRECRDASKELCLYCSGLGAPGRVLVEYKVKVELSMQDDDRTLKVFLSE